MISVYYNKTSKIKISKLIAMYTVGDEAKFGDFLFRGVRVWVSRSTKLYYSVLLATSSVLQLILKV